MNRLFTFTISKNKKNTELEGELIVNVSWKCGVCKTTGGYSTNDYTDFFDETHRIKRHDFACKCDPEEILTEDRLQEVIAK